MFAQRFNGVFSKMLLGAAVAVVPAAVSLGQTEASSPIRIQGGQSNYQVVISSTQRSPSPYAFTGEDPQAMSRQTWEKQAGPVITSVNGVAINLGSPR